MMDKAATALGSLTAVIGFPGLPWLRGRHHGAVNHPLVSLILLVLIVALILWTFRRRPS
jgi:hypothetical protein